MRVPQFIVSVRQENAELAFDWNVQADDPGDAKEGIQADIKARFEERRIWIDRVTSLVDEFERWTKDLGWSTRRIEKKLEDPRIGDHRVPALVMQSGRIQSIQHENALQRGN